MIGFDKCIILHILTFSDDGTLYMLQGVNKELRVLVEGYISHTDNKDRFWPRQPQKIGLPKAIQQSSDKLKELQSCAKAAVAHMQLVLSQRSNCFQTIQTHWNSLARRVHENINSAYERSQIIKATSNKGAKKLFSNCVCVFGDEKEYKYTMNFLLPGQDSSSINATRISLDASIDGKKIPLDYDKMNKCDQIHAELRVLLGKYVNIAIDKDLCLFCAITYRQWNIRGRHHTRQLQWYTFHPALIVHSTRMEQAFGKPFLTIWYKLNYQEREQLLALCLVELNALTPNCPKCEHNKFVKDLGKRQYRCNLQPKEHPTGCGHQFTPDTSQQAMTNGSGVADTTRKQPTANGSGGVDTTPKPATANGFGVADTTRKQNQKSTNPSCPHCGEAEGCIIVAPPASKQYKCKKCNRDFYACPGCGATGGHTIRDSSVRDSPVRDSPYDFWRHNCPKCRKIWVWNNCGKRHFDLWPNTKSVTMKSQKSNTNALDQSSPPAGAPTSSSILHSLQPNHVTTRSKRSSDGSFKQPSQSNSLKKSTDYQVSKDQQCTLKNLGLVEVPVAADGDCLFASLLKMGVTAPDGTSFTSVAALRDYVANFVMLDEQLPLKLFWRNQTPKQVAKEVRKTGAWQGSIGDMMPELISISLGIQLVILNADGTVTEVGEGERYTLVRFSQQGPEHYHGTRPAR